MMELDASNPAALALLIQSVEELKVKVDQLVEVNTQVKLQGQRIGELEKDNSGHHMAAREGEAFANSVKGGLKILFIVIGIAQAVFILIGAAMFSAYTNGKVDHSVDEQRYLFLNQRIDDLRQEIEGAPKKEKPQ